MQRLYKILSILKRINNIFFKGNTTRVVWIILEIIIHIIVSGKLSNILYESAKIYLTIIILIRYNYNELTFNYYCHRSSTMQRLYKILSILKRINNIFFKGNTTRVVWIILEIIIHIIVSGKLSNILYESAKIYLTIIIPSPYRLFYKHKYYKL